MVDILIYAIPHDYHVNAVAWGLNHLGIETEIWVPGDLPDMAGVSIFVGDGPPRVRLRHAGRTIDLSAVKVIWNRRLDRPQAPDDAALEDRHVIESQSFEHVENVRSILGWSVPTVNSLPEQAWANRKAVQLETARKLGADVPATLISNDFEEISEFWRTKGRVVVKPYRTISWRSGGDVYASFATRMPGPTEELRRSLELCPQIFQAEVDKVADVRVIAFGAHRFTLEASVDPASDVIDSRFSVNKRKAKFGTIDLPPDVAAFVPAYLEELGLHYGAFDFAVTAENEWLFLECNEGGQFLYLEKILPQLEVLDAFCRWLAELAGRSAAGAEAVLKLADFDRSGDPLRRAFWSTHKQQLGNRAFIEEDQTS
jgi:hypothetical protein